MLNHPFALLLALATLFLFVSCDDDDPDPVNEEEVITTLRVELVPQSGGETKMFEFVDFDGDGGNPPEFQLDTLDANTTYDASIQLLNEVETPPEDINVEIEDEGEDHQFFYLISPGLDLAFAYSDQDDSGRPIGLEFLVQCGDPSSGDWRILLRHEPDKDASGVAQGDPANAGGETDVDVIFPVIIL